MKIFCRGGGGYMRGRGAGHGNVSQYICVLREELKYVVVVVGD